MRHWVVPQSWVRSDLARAKSLHAQRQNHCRIYAAADPQDRPASAQVFAQAAAQPTHQPIRLGGRINLENVFMKNHNHTRAGIGSGRRMLACQGNHA